MGYKSIESGDLCSDIKYMNIKHIGIGWMTQCG